MTSSNISVMRLKYAGTCACGRELPAGERAGYDRAAKVVVCEPCLVSQGQILAPAQQSSLERTYEARKSAREARVRERFPRIGSLVLALTDEPASTRAFKTGAEGEKKAAERILGRVGDAAEFLSNRSLGHGRRDGDIDLIAVTAAGVVVIDVKHYKNAKVEVRTQGGLLTPRTQKLLVGGRDKSAWVESMDKQRTSVLVALADTSYAEVPVKTVLCFVDADLPLFDHLSIGDVAIYGSRELGKRLSKVTGPWDADTRTDVVRVLEGALPPA